MIRSADDKSNIVLLYALKCTRMHTQVFFPSAKMNANLCYRNFLKCLWQYFFISCFERAFKMMKNGVYFIVKALLVNKFIQDLNLICIKMR